MLSFDLYQHIVDHAVSYCVVFTMLSFYFSIVYFDRKESVSRWLFALSLFAASFTYGVIKADIKSQTTDQLCQVKGITCTKEDGSKYQP